MQLKTKPGTDMLRRAELSDQKIKGRQVTEEQITCIAIRAAGAKHNVCQRKGMKAHGVCPVEPS